jgi:hypothetical protein
MSSAAALDGGSGRRQSHLCQPWRTATAMVSAEAPGELWARIAVGSSDPARECRRAFRIGACAEHTVLRGKALSGGILVFVLLAITGCAFGHTLPARRAQGSQPYVAQGPTHPAASLSLSAGLAVRSFALARNGGAVIGVFTGPSRLDTSAACLAATSEYRSLGFWPPVGNLIVVSVAKAVFTNEGLHVYGRPVWVIGLANLPLGVRARTAEEAVRLSRDGVMDCFVIDANTGHFLSGFSG